MRLSILVSLFLLVPAASVAEARWKSDPDSGCKVWHSFPDQETVMHWKGKCIAGKAHGKGKMTWNYEQDGEKMLSFYLGEMKEGKMNGKGRAYFANGDRHYGNFRDDKKHGFGIYSKRDGAGYKGEYQNGMRHGHGVQVWADGSRYEGPFIDDQMHGRGAYYFGNGNRYEGPFVNGRMEGFGSAYYANGNRYEGPFKDDKMHGVGSCLRDNNQWASCEWREGEFVQFAK